MAYKEIHKKKKSKKEEEKVHSAHDTHKKRINILHLFRLLGSLVVLGGNTAETLLKGSQKYLNDIWISKNGTFWEKVEVDAIWSPRAQHGVSVVSNGSF